MFFFVFFWVEIILEENQKSLKFKTFSTFLIRVELKKSCEVCRKINAEDCARILKKF